MIEDYLNLKRGLWSETTIKSTRSRLSTCLFWSETLDPRRIYDQLKKLGYGQYSIQTYLIVASGFEQKMLGRDLISMFLKDNAFMFRNAYQEKTRRVTEEEFNEQLFSAPNPGIYNLLVLLGRCGLRRSEALAARWVDINNGLLKVVGKGQKVRHVPISRNWLREVAGGELIVDSCKGYQYYFKRLSPFSFHDLRAYYATQVASHPELGIVYAKKYLGHASISTTARYVRTDDDKGKKILIGF